MAVLEDAIDAANKNKISTLVVASTSGDTALKLFELVKDGKLRKMSPLTVTDNMHQFRYKT